MPSEAVIERMIVQLIGDGGQYRQMLAEARRITKETTQDMSGRWRDLQGRFVSAHKVMAAQALVLQHSLMKSAMTVKLFGQEVQRAGRNLSLYITAPLVLLGRSAIKAGSDFESGFVGIRKTVNATEQEFARLNQEFRNLAAEIPLTAVELLKIGEIAGQLGIHTNKISDFTRVVAELSVSTSGMSAEEGATSMARFANITQMSQDKFRNLASTLVVLGNTMEANEHEIMEMGLRIAGAGKTVGLATPEILALSSALTSVGIKAEMGGSAISRMMLQVTRDIALGEKTIEHYASISGMSTEDFKNSWERNVGQTLITFLAGLESLDSKSQALALEALELDGIRLHDTMLRSANAVGQFAEAMDLANTGFREGVALGKEAGERFKTFASIVQVAKNQVNLFFTELFETARPALVSLVEGFEGLVKSMKGWSKETKAAIIIIGTLAAALGPFLIITGSLIASIGQLKLAFLFLRPALIAVFGVPGLGQIAAAIGIVIMAIANWDKTVQHLDHLLGPFKELWVSLKELFGELYEELQKLAPFFGDVLNAVITDVIRNIHTFVYVIKNVIDLLTKALKMAEDLSWYKSFWIPGAQINAGGMDKGTSEKMAGGLVGAMTKETGAKPLTTARPPNVQGTLNLPVEPTEHEKQWAEEFNKAFDEVDSMKAKFDEELLQMQLSERDYLISQLEQAQRKGVFAGDLNEVLDAYDKLQAAKKKAAEEEQATKFAESLEKDLNAMRDQRKELELGERAFMAFELARKGASQSHINKVLATYDEIQALEKLAEEEKNAAKVAEQAKKDKEKFDKSIQHTVEARGRGFAALEARREARMRRPDAASKVDKEKEKEKMEKQKQAQLAEKAVQQGMKSYEVLKQIAAFTGKTAENIGPAPKPANIGG